MIKRSLFRLARSPVAAPVIGFAFQSLSGWMPVTRMIEDESLLVFHHPVPTWETHLLIVPKQAVRGLDRLDVNQSSHRLMYLRIVEAAQQVAQKLALDPCKLLVNGGAYQDVPQLHFHLIAGPMLAGDEPSADGAATPSTSEARIETATLVAEHVYATAQGTHLLLRPKEPAPALDALDTADPDVQRLLLDLLETTQTLSRDRAAYALVMESDSRRRIGPLMFHLYT